MLYGAIIAFVLAAGGGVYLAAMLLSNRQPNRAITAIHGLAAVTGLVLLILFTMQAMNRRLS